MELFTKSLYAVKYFRESKNKSNLTVITCCDSVYLNDHGQSFLASFFEFHKENNIQIHLILKANEDISEIVSRSPLRNFTDNKLLSISYEYIPKFVRNDKQRAYFASARFFLTHELLQNSPQSHLLIYDADSVFNANICSIIKETSSYDLALIKRFYSNQENMKFAAGAMLFKRNKTSLKFLRTISNKLMNNFISNNIGWFADQILMWHSYLTLSEEDKELIGSIDHKIYCDWDFMSTSKVWSGKGERKHKDQNYLNLKYRFLD